MQRYFLQEDDFEDKLIRISGEDYHHITRVMRMEPGDQMICVINNQQTALCEITEIANDTVVGTVIEWKNETQELPVKVTIVSGLPKGDKLEYIIRKGTELGAAEFIPFIAARSVVKWDQKKAAKKQERLQKIAKEAAEQSHRTVMPAVLEPKTMDELLLYSDAYDYKLIAFEEEAKRGETGVLASVLRGIKPGQSLLFLFGPEGGLAQNEIDRLIRAGFMACGLGPRILRTETAPLYTLSAVSYQLELLR
ncbi:16S rRNA (uracil(1498)-N(3))-methyltransferase [Peribacillus cavernae]|uniref:Ribosomal RNA small subunit methyltransferase E n=1 Tax=Peribacillus cavernae TaxID=1674310 RepID=A0A3S0VB01_9BACI|nr:16S rRNA (uracil(1498)-N(3))-methyltransferase [Peribacillus cavernae]MDQ0218252.1 16S rRNA (uracil1498-N3)-methyltransferase [Peribacillus cavernae]RUQ28462.1 16S rRNA (uracil(1498)-N(3))-methyltransferase [Peribacillus cavernae]